MLTVYTTDTVLLKNAPDRNPEHGSVDERDMSHRDRLGFSVHQDLVPSAQDNCLVIGMADTSANEHRWIAPLSDPVKVTKFRSTTDQTHSLHFRQSVGVL